MACPNEDIALLFVRGQLEAGEARKVEVHVDACERCYATFTELARAFGSTFTVRSSIEKESGIRHRAPEPVAPPPGSGPLAVGGRFGRYTIQGELGQGGMGQVYLAYDTHLSRPVALKVLRPAVTTTASMGDMALREARAIAQLSHPNVVAVYDAGLEEGLLFIAMEYVPGQSLGAWLASERRDAGQIASVLRQAGHGLIALNEAGLVHRDIKPDNVLVGADGRVRITDFGLAQFGAGGDGLYAGTPAYMAPEQHFARPVDARADQFAFALVLCEAMSGRRPYAGRTIEELRWSIAQGRPDFSPLLSRSLRDVLGRALRLDPATRFPTTRAFLAAFEDALQVKHQVHYQLNVGFLLIMTVVHVVVLFWWHLKPDAAPSATPPTPSTGNTEYDWYFPFVLTPLLIVAAVALLWIPAGVLWAPLNAWGLATKKRWARASTIVYAIFGLFSCIGTPYAAYALITLRKPELKRALEP